MKQLFQTYKSTLIFISRFLILYFSLAFIYNYYLGLYSGQTDPLTIWVGESVSYIYKFLDVNVQTTPLLHESGLKLIINNQYVARIVEGCTAISVIILFIAFIVSLGTSFKTSLIYAFIGSILIFVFNILRIVFLGYVLYAMPQYQMLAHQIIFPVLIYGLVIILWLIFIIKYYGKA